MLGNIEITLQQPVSLLIMFAKLALCGTASAAKLSCKHSLRMIRATLKTTGAKIRTLKYDPSLKL